MTTIIMRTTEGDLRMVLLFRASTTDPRSWAIVRIPIKTEPRIRKFF